MTITGNQVHAWLKDRVERAELSVEECKTAALEHGEAKRKYKVAWARSFTAAKLGGGTVAEAEAVATEHTGDELQRDTVAEALYKTAIEAARTHRTALSAAQTYVSMIKSEMELVGKGPHLAP